MARKKRDARGSDDATPVETYDSNGALLSAGDTIVAIKGLDVKGGTDIKQGEKLTNITLTGDPDTVSAKHKRNGKMILKTEFFKKVG